MTKIIKVLFLDQNIIFFRKGNGNRFIMLIASSFYEALEKIHVKNYLIGASQKILDWLIMFLGKVERTIRSDFKSMFGIMGFSTSKAILGLWFSL